MLKQNPKERFSDRVDDYVRYRPHYPSGVLDIFAQVVRRPSPWTVADIGSGTGILSKLLLDAGHTVLAVEPNDAMRGAAEQELGGNPRFHSISGSAEATGLPDASVDLVTAAQAFHWFDAQLAREELMRVLKPGGIVALIWNTRTMQTDFARDYEAFLVRFGTDYKEVGRRNHPTQAVLSRFFGRGIYERHVLPNAQLLDLAGLRGRLLSASYIPKNTGPEFDAMLEQIEPLFASHQSNGVVTLAYETEVLLGPLA